MKVYEIIYISEFSIATLSWVFVGSSPSLSLSLWYRRKLMYYLLLFCTYPWFYIRCFLFKRSSNIAWWECIYNSSSVYRKYIDYSYKIFRKVHLSRNSKERQVETRWHNSIISYKYHCQNLKTLFFTKWFYRR